MHMERVLLLPCTKEGLVLTKQDRNQNYLGLTNYTSLGVVVHSYNL